MLQDILHSSGVHPAGMNHRSSYRRSMSGHQTATSSVYSNAESMSTDVTQHSAKMAAAVAFVRAQERSSNGLGHKTTLPPSSGHDIPASSLQTTVGGGTRNVIRRRQSVRFVNQNTERQSAMSGRSIGILTEPRPGFAAVRPRNTPVKLPSAYRPVSPISSLGKYSAADEVPGSTTGFPERIKYSVHEDDVFATHSVRYGVRKAKSMFMRPKSQDSFYKSETPEPPPGPSYSYGNGISSIPMPRAQLGQMSLKTHKSMNFLKLARSHSSGGQLSHDLQVQIARDKFLHQTNQQRLRERPSFLFWSKSWKQESANHTSSESDDNEPGALLSWKESRLGGKALRAASKIRSRFRRVFGRSTKLPANIPCQQVEAAESRIQEYTGTDTHDSSSDTDASSSHSASNIYASLSSYKTMTIRLVPPTPRRLPVYEISQGYETPQNVSYAESVYSGCGNSTDPESGCSSLTLKLNDDNQPTTGSAVILETVTYHSPTPKAATGPSSSSGVAEVWTLQMGAGLENTEMDKDEDSSNANYIDSVPIKTQSVAYGHVRESAQINDDDTSIAQERVTIKQPLGELQHNARHNPELTPMLKPTTTATSATHLAENIGFHQSKPPPPPPPLPTRLPLIAADLRPRMSVTPQPDLLPEQPMCDNKAPLKASLADIVISSRTQDNSASPCESPAMAQKNLSLDHPLLNFHSLEAVDVEKRAAKIRAHERLWKVEPQPQTWYANETLRSMLVERGNIKRRVSAKGVPSMSDTNQADSKHFQTKDTRITENERENVGLEAKDGEEDIYGVDGAGLMGPSLAHRNIQLVGLLLSSRRSRITGCSESDSEDAFI